MATKKVEQALIIVGIALLVFVAIFAAAVTTLFLRARRRKANHRATIIHQLRLAQEPPRKSVTSSNGSPQSARKKSIREKDLAKQRMNLAFGVVDDDESFRNIEPPTTYGSSFPMPASSTLSRMDNPFDTPIRGARSPFEDSVRGIRGRFEGKTGGDPTIGGASIPPRPTIDPFASASPQRPSPTRQASPSSAQSPTKTPYRSASSPLKQQPALPQQRNTLNDTTRPLRPANASTAAPSTRPKAQLQNVVEATQSGMPKSTSDRSLNAGYF